MPFKFNFLKSQKATLNQKGFTLVEIMIVLAIIGSIFALMGDKIFGALDKSKIKEAKIQLGQISQAVSMYYTDCGKFPQSLDNLRKADANCANWGPEPYYKKEAKDPWGNAIVLELNGSEFNLKSLGKDGKEGGSGYDKDILLDEEAQ